MEQFIALILVFIIGFIASFIGAIAGGGGLISIPFLIFIGLPPQIAIATSKFGSIGLGVGAAFKFWREKKILFDYVLLLSIIGLAGAYIGANILLNISQDILSKVVGFILLLLLPTIFLKKETGLKRNTVSKNKRILGYLIYFFIMIFGGFFGGGGGTLAIYTLMIFFGFTIVESSATDIIPWFLMSLFSLIIFMANGIVNYLYGISLFFGMLAGGYVGASAAVKKGNKWVKVIFAMVLIFSAIKLIFL